MTYWGLGFFWPQLLTKFLPNVPYSLLCSKVLNIMFLFLFQISCLRICFEKFYWIADKNLIGWLISLQIFLRKDIQNPGYYLYKPFLVLFLSFYSIPKIKEKGKRKVNSWTLLKHKIASWKFVKFFRMVLLSGTCEKPLFNIHFTIEWNLWISVISVISEFLWTPRKSLSRQSLPR